MLASELLGSKWLDEHKDIDITGIAYDSRNVLPGNVFVCIKGFETDGHKYAEMAVKNGASLIVAEDKIDVDVPVWYVENSRVEIAEMACKYYGNPSSKFKLIGITGTNGKTTITYLIKSIIGYENRCYRYKSKYYRRQGACYAKYNTYNTERT